MVSQKSPARKPLVTAALLDAARVHNTGLDTRGLYQLDRCEARAIVRAQAEGLKAYHLRGNLWTVPSGTEPSKAYTIVLNGRDSCDCEAGHSGKLCKHVAIARYTRRQLAEREAAHKAALALPHGPDDDEALPHFPPGDNRAWPRRTPVRLEDFYSAREVW